MIPRALVAAARTLAAALLALVPLGARAQAPQPPSATTVPASAVRIVALGWEDDRMQVWLGDAAHVSTPVNRPGTYRTVPAGVHTVRAAQSDADAEAAEDGEDGSDEATPSRPEEALGEIELEPGVYHTLLLARRGESTDTPAIVLLADELRALPPSAWAALRIVHAREGEGTVRVVIDPTDDNDPATRLPEPVVAELDPYGASPPIHLPGGAYRIRVIPEGTSAAEAESVAATVRGAAVHTLFLVPGDGADGMLWAVDVASPLPIESDEDGR